MFTREAQMIFSEINKIMNIPFISLMAGLYWHKIGAKPFFPSRLKVCSRLCSPLTLTAFHQGHFVRKIIYYTCQCPTHRADLKSNSFSLTNDCTMFPRKYEIATVMFISTCPQFHSHWINRLGKRNFPPLLCCFSWVLITKLICFAWSSGSGGRVGAGGGAGGGQLSSQWKDVLPVELWNPHKQAG